MEITVRHEFREAARWLNGIQRKQLPFATSLALNKTAGRVRDGLMTAMLREIDRPTDFTLNAFKIKNSNKRNLTAWIFAKPIQEKYLSLLVYGGTDGKKHIVPGVKAKLNAHGNLPRNKSRGSTNKKKFFKGTPKGGGPSGLYQRMPANPNSKKIRLIGHFPKSRTYRKLFRYERSVNTSFDRWFSYEWNKAFDRAMLTAR